MKKLILSIAAPVAAQFAIAKKPLFLIAFICFCLNTSSYSQNGWTQKGNGPNKGRAGSFVIGSFGYYGSGNNNGGASETNTWFKYNPASDVWTPIANLPTGMQALEGFSINGKGYAGMGWASGGPLDNFYEYDTTGNQWTAKASYPNTGGQLADDAGSFVLNNEGYILGGEVPYSNLSIATCNKYNPSNNTWTAIASLPQGMRTPVGNSVNGYGYAIFGSNNGIALSAGYKYNVSNNTWSNISSLPGYYSYRYNSFVLNGKLYVLLSTATTFDDFWQYDPVIDSWTQLPDRPFAWGADACLVINNKAYVIGQGNVWEYSPCITTATITATGPTTFCSGNSVTLTASSGASYLWSNGATTSSITVATNGNYTVAVTNGNGCTGTSAATTVTVNPSPVISLPDTTIACGLSTVIDAGSGYSSYLWSNGSTIQTTTVLQSGWYSCSVSNGVCTAIDSEFVSIVYANIQNNDTTICAGTSLQLQATGNYVLKNLFNGNRYIEMPKPGPIGMTPRTYAYWVKTNSTATMNILFYGTHVNAQSIGLQLNLSVGCPNASSGVSFSTGSHNATFVNSNIDNQWHHIAYVMGYNNNFSVQNFQVYVDGTIRGGGCGGNWGGWTYNTDSTVMQIGHPYNWGNYYTGDLSEMGIWSKSMDSTQIKNIYNHGVTADTNQLVNYYRFNVLVSDSILPDLKGGNNGVVKGGLQGIYQQFEGVTSGSNYLWSTGDTTPTINVNPTQTTTYYCTVSNGISSCMDSVKITVNSQASITTSSNTICGTGSVQFVASAGSGYQWYKNNVAIGGAIYQTYNASLGGSYKCVITNGCGTVASNAILITKYSLPNVTLTTSGPTSFCSGGNVVINVTTNASPNASFQWYNGTSQIPGATSTNYTATTAGTYRVYITSTLTGCLRISNGVQVKVLDPTASINASGALTFCAGDSVVFTAITNAGIGAMYQWFKGTNAIAGATGSSYIAKTGGTFKVKVTNTNGCTKLSAGKIVKVNCRIGNESAMDAISVFPNPNSGSFTFAYSGLNETENGTATIQLYNIVGENVYELNAAVENGSIVKELKLESVLSKGMYILKMSLNGQVHYSKVMIQ